MVTPKPHPSGTLPNLKKALCWCACVKFLSSACFFKNLSFLIGSLPGRLTGIGSQLVRDTPDGDPLLLESGQPQLVCCHCRERPAESFLIHQVMLAEHLQ
jgi:hypothetical protein